MKDIKDEHMKYIKLAQKVWHYLNGRYENYEKETESIAKLIHNYFKTAR